ncbi:MMS19 nucleotide excision repair protein homolog [Bombyx mandarina]|uniref:MMS19 nucleotide excision repair protein n=1 Tax=Bombyx mandarina TaxID=7092 RepID=A0A6J2JER5_BOMMA|nr:MMS19 nucleotide excision repair protein homolog [Bombyx mandarina]
MNSIWFKPELAEEIINNNEIFDQTQNVVTDIITQHIDLITLVENMEGILTNKEPESREKGMRFFTKILTELPRDYLTVSQVKFISKFYIDRLKDNHRVIPAVLQGFSAIIEMKNYDMETSGEFFSLLFREVNCQSQTRQDRYNIYFIVKKLMEKDIKYMKSLGPDFVYGFIASMDGERDPRNLIFLFNFLPEFIREIPLGHLVEEMFEVISCYYPIDFHPAPDDPAPVTRQDLATALSPCLCAIPEFAEHCLVLLVEKLDSSLRLAKLDSLRLLTDSCKIFKPESYTPFLKTLWSSIQREISHKADEELKFAAHEALSALVSILSRTANADQAFENFVKGILISMQTAVAEATTVAQFVHATKVLLTAANGSKESCAIITKSMIPAILAYYDFKTSPKLQIASLDFLGDLYDLAKHWDVLEQTAVQVNELPQLCLTVVSQPIKDFQVAGFRTLIRVMNVLQTDLVVPFVEVLMYNVQHSQDDELLKVSIETIHAIAKKYPEIIMQLVVTGRCDIENLTQDKTALIKRLNLLSNLASIDEFTKVIIEEMLKVVSAHDEESPKVIEALSESMSDISLFTEKKITEIDSDHGLVDSVVEWILREINNSVDVSNGFVLIANTIASLPADKQRNLLAKHTDNILDKCKYNDKYYLILESLYISVHQTVYESSFDDIMKLSLELALNSELDSVRTKACILVAHFLNKAEFGQKFELFYELLKNYLTNCSKDDEELCPKLILLYGWITKALILRGSDTFLFWLQKIVNTLSNTQYSKQGSEAIKLIMSDSPNYLSSRQHCRTSLLYRQRMFQNFAKLTHKLPPLEGAANESYLLSWAYVFEKTPKSVLNNETTKITSIAIDSLDYENKDLLLVMIDVLCYFVQAKNAVISGSLQTILPRLVKLSRYVKSMDVRIKSLECLYEIANSYRTSTLLPHKQDILFDLAPSLDDKKRLVRNMAVKARTRWFMIGAPGEDKPN